MAIVARLLPRHWDGRRLLQFLTGLALIALAFAVPAALGPADGPAESPVTIITTVDAPPVPGLPVTGVPAPAAVPGTGPAADAGPGLTLSAESLSLLAESAGAASGPLAQDAPPADASTVPDAAGVPVQARHGGQGICAEARAAVGGATQRAHGQRGPPRA